MTESLRRSSSAQPSQPDPPLGSTSPGIDDPLEPASIKARPTCVGGREIFDSSHRTAKRAMKRMTTTASTSPAYPKRGPVHRLPTLSTGSGIRTLAQASATLLRLVVLLAGEWRKWLVVKGVQTWGFDTISPTSP